MNNTQNNQYKHPNKITLFVRVLLRDEVREIPGGVGRVPMPLDPTIQMCGMDPMKTFMFASAIYPCKNTVTYCTPPATAVHQSSYTPFIISAVVTFFVADSVDSAPEGAEEGHEGKTPERKTCKIIFKSGDDLRQDQLVMQMFNAMDGLLKKVIYFIYFFIFS